MGCPTIGAEKNTNVYDLILNAATIDVVSGWCGGTSLRTAEKGSGSLHVGP